MIDGKISRDYSFRAFDGDGFWNTKIAVYIGMRDAPIFCFVNIKKRLFFACWSRICKADKREKEKKEKKVFHRKL